ncbi:MAG: mitochondrial fission ELM1 family protein [Halioglobus sp.]|nr:mitochondrial fission ELM1 family protein [Halioglobus sp.]
MGERNIEVWCLLGRKAGDNTQMLALAEELGCGYRQKRIVARRWELLVHLRRTPTLGGIDRAASSVLAPPWPDLVISAGRRNEPVARWLRQQSGGRCRLVHIGRPWAPLADWDLVITTPQYFLPRRPNVLHNTLPLHRLSAVELAPAAARLECAVANLPRPRIALLVGGDSGRFVMTPAKGARLGALADDLARAAGGSLLVSDSARTPQLAGNALQAQLSVPHYCYRWAAGGDNPYRGILGQADAFVVTGESMSMLGEAVAMGRPLFIFDVGDADGPWWRLPHNYRYKPLSHRLAMRFGPLRMRRDIGNIQSALVACGAASWLEPAIIERAAAAIRGAPSAAPGPPATNNELKAAAQAVRRLVLPG